MTVDYVALDGADLGYVDLQPDGSWSAACPDPVDGCSLIDLGSHPTVTAALRAIESFWSWA